MYEPSENMLKQMITSIKKYKKRLLLFALLIATSLLLSFTVFSIHSSIRQSRMRSAFLEDFDYMITVLEENFPTLGVVYRRNGVDLLALASEVRADLASRRRLDFETFWTVLRDDFLRYARPVGHLHLIDNYMRLSLGWSNRADSHIRPILSSSPSDPAYLLISRPAPPPSGPNLISNIIDDGRIAYLRISRMRWLPGTARDFEISYLNDFYASIGGFEHLIIDIRGNPGGLLYFFNYWIVGPLVQGPTPFSAEFYHFYYGGKHNNNFFSAIQINAPPWMSEADKIAQNRAVQRFGRHFDLFLHSVAEINDEAMVRLFGDEMIHSQYSHIFDEIMNMDYYFIEARYVWGRLPRSPFDGRVWLLTDEMSRSAAQVAAAFSKEAGFATLVGEPTGGMAVTPWSSNFFALPNSGIIIRYDPTLVTDTRGRPLEYGTEPHFFNRPGLDALQTVLELIAEGVYWD